MIGNNKLHVTFIDDNHSVIYDPDVDREFKVTTRPKTNMFVNGHAVKPRLYIGGDIVNEKQKELTHRKAIAWAKEYFGYTLQRIINREGTTIRFSSKAGCSCGCSPGFIVEGNNVPFDIWMDAV